MYRFNCCLALFLSLIAGIGAGLLFYFGYLPSVTVGTWIAFGFAAVVLLALTIILVSGAMRPPIVHDCLCRYGFCLLSGAVGTLVTTIITLSIALATNVIGAIIVAIGAFFFTLMLLSVIGFLACMLCNHCGCPCNCD